MGSMRDTLLKILKLYKDASPEEYKRLIGKPGLTDEEAERIRTAFFEIIEEPSDKEAKKKVSTYRSLLKDLSIPIDNGEVEE